jgi:hypothetical protein
MKGSTGGVEPVRVSPPPLVDHKYFCLEGLMFCKLHIATVQASELL